MNEPAFPRSGFYNDGGHHDNEPQDGMDLRDYFAAVALQGILSYNAELSYADAAKDAYKYADAMIEARK